MSWSLISGSLRWVSALWAWTKARYRRSHVPPPAPSDDHLLAELRRLQGIPAAVLDDPALMRSILPALKADAALYRNYVYSEDAPLP